MASTSTMKHMSPISHSFPVSYSIHSMCFSPPIQLAYISNTSRVPSMLTISLPSDLLLPKSATNLK